jgi:hypothetical protein
MKIAKLIYLFIQKVTGEYELNLRCTKIINIC